jgi:hypothetical protein
MRVRFSEDDSLRKRALSFAETGAGANVAALTGKRKPRHHLITGGKMP